MEYYIGIDLGGTNVRTILVDEIGTILSEVAGPSHASEGMAAVTDVIKNQIRGLDCGAIGGLEAVAGIGIGVPGLVDPKAKVIKFANNLTGYQNYRICDVLSKEFGKECFIDNDANVAGLAEALLGAGKGYPSVYYITISTGIGGAYIFEGRVVSGNNHHAGEIGNMIVDSNGIKNGVMNAGAIETMASGTALVKIGRSMVKKDLEHAGELFELAHQGNRQAAIIANRAIDSYAIMLANIAHTIDPHCFVLGGGVMNSADYFLADLTVRFNNRLYPGMVDGTPVFKAQLEMPGALGAAMLAKSHLRGN
ncbi:MAG: ROK family protein [Erysipelotrichaceae bacterium]|nr:ROK family protein [Erysipelotrichaceae bacterium]MDD3808843.1 ROK family protein [Erysipelotrichaceae bacterium]